MAEIDLVIGGADKDLLTKRIHDALEGEGEQNRGNVGRGHPAHRRQNKGVHQDFRWMQQILHILHSALRPAAVSGACRPARLSSRCVELAPKDTARRSLLPSTWGRMVVSCGPKLSLGELVGRILAETEIERLRLSSIEPEDFDLSMLKMWSDRRLCRHFHLAIDSGCDATLKRMRRRYTYAQYRDLVGNIRSWPAGCGDHYRRNGGFSGRNRGGIRGELCKHRRSRFRRQPCISVLAPTRYRGLALRQ